jgi:hypothetical protein
VGVVVLHDQDQALLVHIRKKDRDEQTRPGRAGRRTNAPDVRPKSEDGQTDTPVHRSCRRPSQSA